MPTKHPWKEQHHNTDEIVNFMKTLVDEHEHQIVFKSKSKGMRKGLDWFVYFTTIWNQGWQRWSAGLQLLSAFSMSYIAIQALNAVFNFININMVISEGYVTFIVPIAAIAIMIMGWLSYRHFRLVQRSTEMGQRGSPQAIRSMDWQMQNREDLNDIKNMLKEILNAETKSR